MSVTKETQTLSVFVRKVMESKGLTARKVEEKSGNLISHSYVNKIKNGDSTNPSPSHLQALAKGLGESEELIFALVRGEKVKEQSVSLRIKAEGFEGLDEGDLAEIAEFIKFKKMQKK